VLRDAGPRVVADIRSAKVWILELACLRSEIVDAIGDVMCDGAMYAARAGSSRVVGYRWGIPDREHRDASCA
jgi:hypothetical protein